MQILKIWNETLGQKSPNDQSEIQFKYLLNAKNTLTAENVLGYVVEQARSQHYSLSILTCIEHFVVIM